MDEKVPKIFKNKVDNIKTKIQNEYYYKNINEKNDIDDKREKVDKIALIDKIKSIFKRSDFIYQTDITIINKNGKSMNKKIVGIKDNYLLTLDEEKIHIDDIYDIK